MRPQTPNSYHLRPGTPGTPGTFATEGRPYSSAGSYGMGLSESGSHEMLKYYDSQGQFGGRPGSGGPNPDGSEDASTYYFNKEGGRVSHKSDRHQAGPRRDCFSSQRANED